MGALTDRCDAFCRRFGLRVPILLAPMAGACPPSLSIAVGEAGGMGGCGALTLSPQEMRAWAEAVRAASAAPFQINLWVPESPPPRTPDHEARVRQFLAQWGPPVPENAANEVPRDFGTQCEALLALRPAAPPPSWVFSPPQFVAALRSAGIAWYAVVTTVQGSHPGRSGRSGCDRRSRNGSRRPPRSFRKRSSGAAAGGTLRTAAASGRCSARACRRDWRNRRRTRHRGGMVARRERRADRHGVPPLSGSRHPTSVV